MRLFFTLVSGEKLEYSVANSSVTIGRSNRCDVVIPNPGVSRQHLRLEVSGDKIFVTDLGSTNGVQIDGQRIPPNIKIHYSPELTLSFGAVLSTRIDLAASGDAPTLNPNGSETRTIKLELEDRAEIERKKGRIKKPRSPAPLPAVEEEVKSSQGLSPLNIIAAMVVTGAIFWYFRQG